MVRYSGGKGPAYVCCQANSDHHFDWHQIGHLIQDWRQKRPKHIDPWSTFQIHSGIWFRTGGKSRTATATTCGVKASFYKQMKEANS